MMSDVRFIGVCVVVSVKMRAKEEYFFFLVARLSLGNFFFPMIEI